MSTPSVVVIGSMNADDSIRVRTLPAPGETITALGVSTALGGKGANQAVAAARGGASVRFVGAAGADDGDAVVGAIAAEGIDVEGVQRLEGVPTGRAIVMIDDAAENSIVVLPGANRGFPVESIEAQLAALQPGELVLLQDEIPAQVNRAAAAAARAAGATVVWNAAPAPTSADELVHDVDLLVVNEHELEAVAELLGVATGAGPEGAPPRRPASTPCSPPSRRPSAPTPSAPSAPRVPPTRSAASPVARRRDASRRSTPRRPATRSSATSPRPPVRTSVNDCGSRSARGRSRSRRSARPAPSPAVPRSRRSSQPDRALSGHPSSRIRSAARA
nr:PfkB family carbohydrate kinase [Arenivirga flava]